MIIAIEVNAKFTKDAVAALFAEQARSGKTVSCVKLIMIEFHSDQALTDEHIADFSSLMQQYFSGKKIVTIDGMHHLAPQIVTKLLRHKDFVDGVSDDVFLRMIISSKKAAQCTLDEPTLKKRLNQHKSTVNSQTFEFSCTARSILFLLLTMNLIAQQEFTRSKELEIFMKVWLTPGFFTDVEQIIPVLMDLPRLAVIDPKSELKMDGNSSKEFDVTAFENEAISKSWQEWSADLFKPVHTKFVESSKNRFFKFKSSEAVNESDFPPGTSLLLPVGAFNSMHMMFGTVLPDGKVKVIEPADGSTCSPYKSMRDYMENHPSFLGVGYRVMRRNTR